MRKFLATLLVLLLLVIPTVAEGLNLEEMDDSSLLALKKAVDMEYSSRLDSEPLLLEPGTYTVGKDIKAGRWYARVNTYKAGTEGQATLRISPSDHGDNLYLSPRLNGQSSIIEVTDGYSIQIDGSPLMFCRTEFDESNAYKYEAPEGTFVPEGQYIVGEHIPVGAYRVCPAFFHRTQIAVYRGESDSRSEVYHVIKAPASADRFGYILLMEGDLVWVYSSGAIFQKEDSLNFDFD